MAFPVPDLQERWRSLPDPVLHDADAVRDAAVPDGVGGRSVLPPGTCQYVECYLSHC